MMKLSVKSPDGKVEIFDGVDNWSFSTLRRQVVQRFNLKRFSDFALFFGNRELPVDDAKIFESDVELVSGDRLRLVVNEKGFSSADINGSSSEILAKTGSSNLDNAKRNESVFEIVLDEMKQKGFERVGYKDGDTRWKFRHSNSILPIEIDFRVYNDQMVKYVHITASVYRPFGRLFLEPVVLEEDSNDLKRRVSECLISPLKLALLGHENPFLRLLGISVVAEDLFEMLDAKSVLRLERTNKYALKICRSHGMERIWKFFCRRDFGKDYGILKKESYREAYKRLYIRHVREHSFVRNVLEPDTQCNIPVRVSFPHPTYGPINPDPDIPEGPFYPFANPYMGPSNPFSFPSPGNPLDPFYGRELLPNRPTRPAGFPRVFPRGPRAPNQRSMFRGYM
ncbi:hypothetical protein ACH3XW_48300 [Acanthocheilonema viteae]